MSYKYVDRNGKEVRSDYGYAFYERPKDIDEQIFILRSFFPNLGSVDIAIAKNKFPNEAEGWFAIPRWEKIAPTYGEAVYVVLDLIKQTRCGRFLDHFKGEIKSKHLFQSRRCPDGFQVIGDQQKDHDIFIVAAQFGMRHPGISANRVLEVKKNNEFVLGVFAVGIMLLTHPKRFAVPSDIGINCAGDDLFGIGVTKNRYDVINFADLIPVLWFDFDTIIFDKFFLESDHPINGTPSAFFPSNS